VIAEDEEGMAAMLQYRLEKEGYLVTIVDDGAEVVRIATELQPDLVLMDAGLPTQSGIAALRQIRANPSTSSLQVVMLSGRDDHRDIRAAMAAGADAYLVKPVEPMALIKCAAEHTTSTAPTDTNDSLFDLDILRAWLDDDESIRDHVQRFVDSTSIRLQTLRSASNSGKTDEVAEVAHQLRGSLANLKAHAAISAALSLEQCAKDGLTVSLDEIEDRVAELVEALVDWMSKTERSDGNR